MLASGDTYANGSTGGEASHILTETEMPYHHHQLGIYNSALGSGDYLAQSTPNAVIFNREGSANIDWNGTFGDRMENSGYTGDAISYTGGSQPHNNMPPYLAINVWKRVR